MIEPPSGVAASTLRHALRQEFYLLAFAHSAQHGMNGGLGRDYSGAVRGAAGVENL
jgi:hypothetical protein